jgi:hypothetical protein
MKKYTLAIRMLFSFIKNVMIGKRQLIGADMQVHWTDMHHPIELLDYYASFSKVDESEDFDFDEFGIPDDEIFFYFKNFSELLQFIIKGESHDNWAINDCYLVFN